MHIIPSQIRDKNLDEIKSAIPRQDDLVIKSLSVLVVADAEIITNHINDTWKSKYPITSIRRSLHNLLRKNLIKPEGWRETSNGGKAVVYGLVKKQTELFIKETENG